MGSLISTLSSATNALMAQEEALSVTNDNISNADTADYSREIINFVEDGATEVNGVSIGNGVTVESVTSVTDELLNMRIQDQTSDQSSATAQVNALDELQTLFPSSGTSLSTALSSFFTGLTALSSNPDSTADRDTAISDAQTLVDQFNSISEGLSSPVSSLNTTVSTDVTSINQLTSEAASLNKQIVAQDATGQTSGTLSDQLNSIETQLSSLTNISVVHTKDGDDITTGTGTPLVLGSQSYALSTGTDSSGNTTVLDSEGTDITSKITSGDLGGTLKVRDTDIPSLLSSLNTLASQFVTAFNSAQEEGYDANGDAGTALFSGTTASTISLATTDGDAIAASSDGTSGSNGNVTNLTALETSDLATGSGSATSQAASITYQIGELTSDATADSTAISTSLTSLTDQQSSISGVSIDEESANLIRYEQAYQAAAKVVTTIESLFDTTIAMISGT